MVPHNLVVADHHQHVRFALPTIPRVVLGEFLSRSWAFMQKMMLMDALASSSTPTARTSSGKYPSPSYAGQRLI
jgi:hypothetical protein